SFAHLFAALRRHFSFERLLLVVGVLADKDLDGIIREISRGGVDTVITTATANPRAMPPTDLAAALARVEARLSPLTRATPSAALAEALRLAGPRDLVCVAGSLYLAGEALRWLAAQPETSPGAVAITGVDHP
ncbi:MAG: hypothetical protein IVW57_15035, partial [Ktedonobacterales bacterium]|nr:hypothetical protein [Ktedonobacterales bacterium]